MIILIFPFLEMLLLFDFFQTKSFVRKSLITCTFKSLDKMYKTQWNKSHQWQSVTNKQTNESRETIFWCKESLWVSQHQRQQQNTSFLSFPTSTLTMANGKAILLK